MNTILKSLSDGFGLNDHESSIYTALLSLGGGNVTEVSNKAGIKRTTTNYYLEGLMAKGLLYKSIKGKRTLYFAIDPAELPKLIESKKQAITRALPRLQEIYQTGTSKPGVRFYEGKEGLKNLYREMFKTHQTVYSVFSPQSFFKIFTKEENHELLAILKENGAELRNLVEKDQLAKSILQRPEYKDFIKSKVLPESFTFATDLMATKNKVIFISFNKLMGTLIEDEAIANLQRNFLKNLWAQS